MGLHPTLAKIRRNLPAVARSLGFQARVTSGYRSSKKQAWLYDRWQRGLQAYPVARPGTSDHEKGLALDVVSTDTNKLVSLLTAAGLSWLGPADPVHFSLTGLKTQTSAKKATPKSSARKKADKILDWTSWVPGPVGWVSMGLDIFI